MAPFGEIRQSLCRGRWLAPHFFQEVDQFVELGALLARIADLEAELESARQTAASWENVSESRLNRLVALNKELAKLRNDLAIAEQNADEKAALLDRALMTLDVTLADRDWLVAKYVDKQQLRDPAGRFLPRPT